MTSLSWLIYWAAVFGKLGVFLVAAGTIVCGSVGIVSFVWLLDGFPEYPFKHVKMAIVSGLSFFFISIFIPDKNTVYAIAAAEVGQKIATNPEVQGIASDASKALRVWINKQLEEPKKEK